MTFQATARPASYQTSRKALAQELELLSKSRAAFAEKALGYLLSKGLLARDNGSLHGGPYGLEEDTKLVKIQVAQLVKKMQRDNDASCQVEESLHGGEIDQDDEGGGENAARSVAQACKYLDRNFERWFSTNLLLESCAEASKAFQRLHNKRENPAVQEYHLYQSAFREGIIQGAKRAFQTTQAPTHEAIQSRYVAEFAFRVCQMAQREVFVWALGQLKSLQHEIEQAERELAVLSQPASQREQSSRRVDTLLRRFLSTYRVAWSAQVCVDGNSRCCFTRQ